MTERDGRSRGDAEARRGDWDEITGAIINDAMRLHRDLGPGLLESVYEAVLEKMLVGKGLSVERQKRVIFDYAGLRFDEGLRIDLHLRASASPREIQTYAPSSPGEGTQPPARPRLPGASEED